ncbi:uncharacterized protein CTHT_0045420 [Thermochaetoides thermophila DSM 1495]|uniref:Carboxylic ester hydrolase n=1 Tax=Chaetomium thermophilum (strain DSM 1495 / CBS 144.50 / IMI 039719) TaxID=759272 RepID=G0S9D2_CHATD|nr:hypothetical protein CTHT_0045420 [Thermochaetoides thermophila DSM 1495]EGS20043.1 hypothetical protein CTHT_0045420 [Thermochaetoides thermophila DSM 1495]
MKAITPLILISLAQVPSIFAQLTVQTTTGIYTGLIDPVFPNVRQFRAIRYAEPPLGQLRWLPPVPVPPSTQQIFSYTFPPSCTQYLSSTPVVFTALLTNFSIPLDGQPVLPGEVARTSSEDCLFLSLFAPLTATSYSNLPVILFFPGGAFTIGGIDVSFQNPAPWVERSQSHIVVVANYRLDIAGFPGAAGLSEQNLGLLDQRAALEWVRDNIAPFGGDPTRITLWGHSAGGIGADMLAHAFPSNPIAHALFLQSGTAMFNLLRLGGQSEVGAGFSFVARNLGCDFPNDPVAELQCMRQIPMNKIMNFAGQYRENGTTPLLPFFFPIPDGRLVFENYTQSAIQGRLASIPVLVSATSNEAASLTFVPADLEEGPNQTDVDTLTVLNWVCMASNTTQERLLAGVTTYRYQYAGNFSSVTPYPWLGAYHASDIPMIMGTFETIGDTAEVTEFQRQVAYAMQDYLLIFMNDPENGLRRFGWFPYGDQRSSTGGRDLVRFGSHGIIAQVVDAETVDGACTMGRVYDSSP